jgi:hypothetical protein
MQATGIMFIHLAAHRRWFCADYAKGGESSVGKH